MTAWLQGGGEMGARIRAYDWSGTALGAPDGWPGALRGAVGTVLACPFPMVLAWGPGLVTIHNDAYVPLLGGKPDMLGRPFLEVWPEARDVIAPLIERALAEEPSRFEDAPFTLLRNGYPEEAFFDFSFSPVRDESGAVVGLLNIGVETTSRVLAGRRQLFRLALQERIRTVADPADVVTVAAEALGRHLGVAQVAYAKVEPGGGSVLTERVWNDGTMSSNAGRQRLANYGPAFIADLQLGRTVAIGDVRLDPRTSSPEALASFANASIAAFLNLPVIKAGRLAAILAVYSTVPRAWSAEEVGLTEEVAARTWEAVERARVDAALRGSEERWRRSFEQAPGFIALLRGPDSRFTFVNAAYARLFGERGYVGKTIREAFPELEVQGVQEMLDRVHATGERLVAEQMQISLERPGQGPLEMFLDFIYEPLLDDAGRVDGIFIQGHDVTARKHAEDRQALLAREVDHRAKNVLAVVLAVLRLTRAERPADFVEAVEGRVAAIARAHGLLASAHWAGADLATVVTEELAVYLGGDLSRGVIDGPPAMLATDAAQPMAMVLHELATNAAKYGALSVPEGRVRVSWARTPDGGLDLEWLERGGPPVAGPPDRAGFGSGMVEAAAGQLGGTARFAWEPEGLRLTLNMAPSSLARIEKAAPRERAAVPDGALNAPDADRIGEPPNGTGA